MDGAAKPSAEAAKPGFWRRLRTRLRFGLGGLVLFVLFLGSLAAVWVRWEAWVYAGPYYGTLPQTPSQFDFESVYKQLPRPIPRIDRIHTENLRALEEVVLVANDGTWFLTRDHEHQIRCRDAKNASIMPSTFSEFGADIEVSPDGRSFVVKLRLDNRNELYSSGEQAFLGAFKELGYFSRDGAALLYIKNDQLVVLDTTTGANTGTCKPFGAFNFEKDLDEAFDNLSFEDRHSERIHTIIGACFLRIVGTVGTNWAVLSRKNQYLLFDFRKGKTVATLKESASSPTVEDAYISPDESRCYLVGEHLMGWDIAQNKKLFDAELPCYSVVQEAYADPDRFLVTEGCEKVQGFDFALRIIHPMALVDGRNGGVLWRWPECYWIHFLNANEMVIEPSRMAEDKTSQLWRRRHPEWWWGHFYRPEVWVAILLGALWLWRVVRAFRSPCSL